MSYKGPKFCVRVSTEKYRKRLNHFTKKFSTLVEQQRKASRKNILPDFVCSESFVEEAANPGPQRRSSLENTSLTEVITIYERLKKSRDQDPIDVYRHSNTQLNIAQNQTEEAAPLEPFNVQPETWSHSKESFRQVQKVLDFNKFKNLEYQQYHYYSSATGLIQAPSVEELKYVLMNKNMNYVKLFKSKMYWLNITDPSAKDLDLLATVFGVHDLTLKDIKEGNTEEKIEVYKHYTFISLRLLSGKNCTGQKIAKSKQHQKNHQWQDKKRSDQDKFYQKESAVYIDMPNQTDAKSFKSSVYGEEENEPVLPAEDVDFNILLFSDFIITVHDKHWGSIKDVLGFLHLLCTYGNSILTPDWVLFSIFIELAQDAKYSVSLLEPKILNVQIAEIDNEKNCVDAVKLSQMLNKIFKQEFEIHTLSRFIKPKMKILKYLQLKCNKRLGPVIKLLSNTCTEFEELLDELIQFRQILERSKDTYLTMASVQQSLEANDMGKVMKRISEHALIFLPIQAIAGYVGMNVKVPFQDVDGTLPFWGIVAFSLLFGVLLISVKKYFLDEHTSSWSCFKCKTKQADK